TAAQAGYNPMALADILFRLDRDVASQSGQEHRFSIFDSHPMTETRLKDIRKRAAALTPTAKPPVASDTAALFAKPDGLGWGENPEAGVFHGNQFLQPVIGFTVTFPAGWKNQNMPQFVMSMHPKREAILMLGLASGESDPETAGEKFVQQMRTEAKVEPISARKASVSEFPAYVVTYKDRSGRAPAHLYFTWVAMAGNLYQLI